MLNPRFNRGGCEAPEVDVYVLQVREQIQKGKKDRAMSSKLRARVLGHHSKLTGATEADMTWRGKHGDVDPCGTPRE